MPDVFYRVLNKDDDDDDDDDDECTWKYRLILNTICTQPSRSARNQ